MGQMRRFAPVVYMTMLIATLAISGVPPFSGFFSKDEILLEVFASGQYGLWLIGVLTALLTAYYMFRLFFIVFEGKNALHAHTPHDVSWVMKAPLVVLAIGAFGSGFLGLPELVGGSHFIGSWLGEWGKRALHVSHETEWMLIAVNCLVSAVGIAVAYKRFAHYDLRTPLRLEGMIFNKFYVDELYNILFVRSIARLSELLAVSIDVKSVDRIVMGLSHGFIRIGHMLAIVQNAHVRFYAGVMVLGVSAMALYLIVVVG